MWGHSFIVLILNLQGNFPSLSSMQSDLSIYIMASLSSPKLQLDLSELIWFYSGLSQSARGTRTVRPATTSTTAQPTLAWRTSPPPPSPPATTTTTWTGRQSRAREMINIGREDGEQKYFNYATLQSRVYRPKYLVWLHHSIYWF